jgi:hypothetical protein
MMRAISRTAALAAVLAMLATFCAAEEYAPAQAPAPAATSNAPEGPAFTEMELLPTAGQAPNGLRLTLTADQLVLPETPGAAGQPLTVQPTALHLLFRNVSDQPIVFDTYNLANSRLGVVVVGPDKQSVVLTYRQVPAYSRKPLPIDYPQIEPGNPFLPLWAAAAPLRFPGDFNSVVTVNLYKPGDYMVQVVYSRPQGAGSLIADTWRGTVVSNTLIFHVVGPPPPETAPAPAPTSQPSASPTKQAS